VSVLTNGTVSIGSLASPFTIGSSGRKSFIYNNMPTLDSTNLNGIYLGTDGISLGGGNFIVTNGGVLTAQSGTIGGWEIEPAGIHKGDFWLNRIANNVVVDNTIVVQGGKYNPFSGEYPFQVTSGGAMIASNCKVAGDLVAKSLTLQNNAVDVNGTSQLFYFHADFNQFKLEYTTYTSEMRSKTQLLQDNGHLSLEAITEEKSGGKKTVAGIDVNTAGQVILSSTDFDSLGGSNSGITLTPNKITVSSGTLEINCENMTLNGVPFSGGTANLYGQLVEAKDKAVEESIKTVGDTLKGYSTIEQRDAAISAYVTDLQDTSGVYLTPTGIKISGGKTLTLESGGTINISSGNFKVDEAGNLWCKSLKVFNENGTESTIDLSSSTTQYPLWKLYYHTIKKVNGNVITLSNGTTINFKTAASFDLSGQWSNGEYIVDMIDRATSTTVKSNRSGKMTRDKTDADIKSDLEASSHKSYISILDSDGGTLIYILADASDACANSYLEGYYAGGGGSSSEYESAGLRYWGFQVNGEWHSYGSNAMELWKVVS